jgi:AcrR family transcriptional regulator
VGERHKLTAEEGDPVPRTYRFNARARGQAATRRSIVDAAVYLHENAGFDGATVTAIAARAGVSRLTVYRHFPDEGSLFSACIAAYNESHPLPDSSTWARIKEPEERLVVALTDVYAYYEDNQRILASGASAVPSHPELLASLKPFFEALQSFQELLAVGWGSDGRPGSLLAGALGHALSFVTWRGLRHEQGLNNVQAVQLMAGLVRGAVERRP